MKQKHGNLNRTSLSLAVAAALSMAPALAGAAGSTDWRQVR